MKVKTILKFLGFAVLLAGFVLLIRPDLFWKKTSNATHDEISKKDEAFENSKKPSLMISDKSKIKDGHTEYAEGYSSKDFDAGVSFYNPSHLGFETVIIVGVSDY
jgi:hypothetical protein